jgi:hypothetical protein
MTTSTKLPRLGAVLAGFVVAAVAGATTAWPASLPVSSKQLTVYRTCVLDATTSAGTAVFDSWVDQRNPTTNNNSSTALQVASNTTRNQRTYTRFDLAKCSPTVPASASVKSATLRLYAGAPTASCRTHDLFSVATSWSETTITWNNQPFGTALNNPAQSQRKSSMTIGTPAGCQNTTTGYVNGWDVTTDVQAFVAGTSTNNGWMIRDDVEGSSTAFLQQYGGKSNNSAVAMPQLLVTYAT